MNLAVFLVLFFAHRASAVIYRLNDTAYAELPALFQLENYRECLRGPGDVYCYVQAELAPDASPLYATIQEYSEYNTTHFEHRVVHRGLCARSCRAQLGARAAASEDLENNLDACINNTLYQTHGLQSRLIKEKVLCTKFGESTDLDTGDYVVAAVVMLLLLLLLVGSLYDEIFAGNHGTGGKVLLCFSVRRNWRRLVVPSGEGPDPKLRRLKCFNGLKLFTTVFVILGHSPLVPMSTTNNPSYFETTYHSPLFALIYNGSLIVQTFFVVSGFLLSYNVLRQRHVSWSTLPKGVVLRWLRLTPPYAAVLAFACTWQRHIGSGPFWKSMVEVEVRHCRRDWYYSLLYIYNYVDYSQCLPQTWYLGADMQLSVLGLAMFCLLSGMRARKMAVAALFVIGLLTPAAHTFFQNLNAILLVTPEVALNFFVSDPTFNNLYKRGHTNIVCYAIGLALGMVVHRLQEENFDVAKFKKYRYVYWAVVPLGFLQIMSGAVFYIDGIEVPLAVRAIYSSAIKTVFGLCVFVFIGGTIFKLENVYRGMVEWRGWAAPARVSYCAFLVHASVIRYSAAEHTSLVHSSFYLMTQNFISILVVSFVLALPLWLMVEAPCAQLVKVGLGLGPERLRESNMEKEKTISTQTPVEIMVSKETVNVRF